MVFTLDDILFDARYYYQFNTDTMEITEISRRNKWYNKYKVLREDPGVWYWGSPYDREITDKEFIEYFEKCYQISLTPRINIVRHNAPWA